MAWFGIPTYKKQAPPAKMAVTFDNDVLSWDSDRSSRGFPLKLFEDLPSLRDRGIFLCGGAALALYLNHVYKSINDYDFFVQDSKAADFMRQYLEAKFGWILHMQTENAWTFKGNDAYGNPAKVQIIIKKFHQNYQEVFETFDFSICKIGFDGTDFHFGPNTRQHILEKKLVLEGPVNEDFVKRWYKYSIKGFKMARKEVAAAIRSNPNITLATSERDGY